MILQRATKKERGRPTSGDNNAPHLLMRKKTKA
jgi:hypothetical protein